MVHRCGEDILRKDLPTKREAVVKLALTSTQEQVYRAYLRARWGRGWGDGCWGGAVGTLHGKPETGWVWLGRAASREAHLCNCAQPVRQPSPTCLLRRLLRGLQGVEVYSYKSLLSNHDNLKMVGGRRAGHEGPAGRRTSACPPECMPLPGWRGSALRSCCHSDPEPAAAPLPPATLSVCSCATAPPPSGT